MAKDTLGREVTNEFYKDIERASDCCGCGSFPYVLCFRCYEKNNERQLKKVAEWQKIMDEWAGLR